MSDHVTHDIHKQTVEDHHHPSSTKIIWRTFWILLGITVFEVGIAFTTVPKSVLKWVFITLTLVKAYYIVFFFMHLKHEKKPMAKIILLPFLFIIYFIILAMTEGNALKDLTAYVQSF